MLKNTVLFILKIQLGRLKFRRAEKLICVVKDKPCIIHK